MSILDELVLIFDALQIPVETGVFSGTAPDEYIVLTPLVDVFEVYADNRPQIDTQEARISLYSKGNYLSSKKSIETALLAQEFVVTDRTYVGYEDDTGYHHCSIDTAKFYNLEV